MKRFSLLLIIVWLNGLYANHVFPSAWHRLDEPVKIRERHVDFYIFPDGSFDFNAHGSHYQYAGHTGVLIQRDRYGKIRRVGNIFINYNRYGQVSRIGRIFIKYNRRGLVERIGHRFILYNRRGYYLVRSHRYYRPGYVYGSTYYYGPACNMPIYENNFSYDDEPFEYGDEEIYNDDDYYYRSSNRQPESASSKKIHKNRRH